LRVDEKIQQLSEKKNRNNTKGIMQQFSQVNCGLKTRMEMIMRIGRRKSWGELGKIGGGHHQLKLLRQGY
jgi:hypothetical protein